MRTWLNPRPREGALWGVSIPVGESLVLLEPKDETLRDSAFERTYGVT